MKRSILMAVVSFIALAIADNYGAAAAPPQVWTPGYFKIDSVDAANFSFTVSKVPSTVTGGAAPPPAASRKPPKPEKFTITAFTKITINEKPGKFEDLKEGMKVVFRESGRGTVSQIDAMDNPSDTNKK